MGYDRIEFQIASRAETAPGYGRIGQHVDYFARLVVAHQRCDVPARRGGADWVHVVFERVTVGAVGVGAVLAHDFQIGYRDQREDVVVGEFGDAFGLDGNLEFVGCRCLQNVGRRQSRDGVAFGDGLLFEDGAVEREPHLRETFQRVVVFGCEFQAETVAAVRRFEVDRAVVLGAVERILSGLGARNDVLAGRVADHESLDIARQRDFARGHSAYGREVDGGGIGSLGDFADCRNGDAQCVGVTEVERGGTGFRAVVLSQREGQPLVCEHGFRQPLVALLDGGIVGDIVDDLVGVGYEVICRGRNRALLCITLVGLDGAVQFERRLGDSLRDAQHRGGGCALGVFDEEGQVGQARGAGLVALDGERHALVRDGDLGNPGRNGLRLRFIVALFAFGARHDGYGFTGHSVRIVVGDGSLHVVDAVPQVGVDGCEDSRWRLQ